MQVFLVLKPSQSCEHSVDALFRLTCREASRLARERAYCYFLVLIIEGEMGYTIGRYVGEEFFRKVWALI